MYAYSYFENLRNFQNLLTNQELPNSIKHKSAKFLIDTTYNILYSPSIDLGTKFTIFVENYRELKFIDDLCKRLNLNFNFSSEALNHFCKIHTDQYREYTLLSECIINFSEIDAFKLLNLIPLEFLNSNQSYMALLKCRSQLILLDNSRNINTDYVLKKFEFLDYVIDNHPCNKMNTHNKTRNNFYENSL